MVALPLAGSFGYDPANRHNSDMPALFAAWLEFVRATAGGQDEATFTVSGGSITPDRAGVVVDLPTGVAAANLDSIATTNLPVGFVILVRSASSARVPTLRNGQGGAGQILTAKADNIALTDPSAVVALQRKATGWRELFRSYGADAASWQAFLGMAWAATVTGLATQTQAIAGTDAGRLVSALTLRQTLVDKGWMQALTAFTGTYDPTKWLLYGDGTNLYRLPGVTALAGAPYGVFKPADVTLTLNDFHEFSHGFGAVPSLTKTWLVCTTADLGYSPGMIVETPDLRAYASNTLVAWESAPSVKVNGGSASVTPSRWSARVWCWK